MRRMPATRNRTTQLPPTFPAGASAITRDLKDRARYMPRIIAYDVRTSMPSLALANRLYGDGSRADELRAENDVPHPLFMPPGGRALSA